MIDAFHVLVVLIEHHLELVSIEVSSREARVFKRRQNLRICHNFLERIAQNRNDLIRRALRHGIAAIRAVDERLIAAFGNGRNVRQSRGTLVRANRQRENPCRRQSGSPRRRRW